jgi:hypothetical protein
MCAAPIGGGWGFAIGGGKPIMAKLASLLTVIFGAAVLSTAIAPAALAQHQLSQSCIVNGDPNNHVMPTQVGSTVVCTFANTDSTYGQGEWLYLTPTIPAGVFLKRAVQEGDETICYYLDDSTSVVHTGLPYGCVPNIVNVLITFQDTDADTAYSFLTPPLLNGNWTGLCSNSGNPDPAANQNPFVSANGLTQTKTGFTIAGSFVPAGNITKPIDPTVCNSTGPVPTGPPGNRCNLPGPSPNLCDTFIPPLDETVIIKFTLGGPFPSTPKVQEQLAIAGIGLGVLATAAAFVPGVNLAVATALGVASAGVSVAAVHDPPDLNYTSVVTPAPPNIDVSGLQPAARQLTLTLEQVIALSNAISTTTDRATGAFLDGDSASQQLQLAARPDFESQLQAVMAQLPAQFAAFGQELVAAGFDPATITAAQVSAQLQSITTNGLPSSMISELNALGIDQATQAQIATQLAGADPALVLSDLQNRFAVGPLMPPDLPDASNLPQLAAVLPASRSVAVGNTATAFATIINTGTSAATACGIAPDPSLPINFSYQTTNPATNALTGNLNTPVNLAPGASQSYVIAVTPTSTFPPIFVDFAFFCANANAAPVTTGLNTLLLSAATAPVPDIVALAASGDPGIVDIPGASGAGAFAVATVNVGASGAITASANTGSATLPVTLTICQTDPTSGNCLAAPAASVATTINASQTPTFGIFVAGSGTVPFDPANSRVFVQFADSGGTVRGETSVAVRTQ